MAGAAAATSTARTTSINIRDPWMGLNELIWDIDFIPKKSPWEVEVASEGPDSLYQ